MTRSARQFVGPLTFEAITRHRVITGQFEPGANADIEHISLATTSSLLLVAPATANIIGKFADGIADDFLTSLYLATRAPVLLAPAMNTNMWEHEAVQRNLAVLAARGVRFVDPGEGFLACGWMGKGGWPNPRRSWPRRSSCCRRRRSRRPARRRVGRADLRGHRPGSLRREPIERAMGYALAAEAAARGADVGSSAGPSGWTPRRRRGGPGAARRRDARRDARARGGRRRGHHGRRRRGLHAGGAGGPEDQKDAGR